MNLVAIVIGVYLGFAITSFQQHRAERQLADRYLASLRSDLEKDRETIGRDVQQLQALVKKGSRLVREPSILTLPQDSIQYYFTALTTQTTFQPNSHTYLAMVNDGSIAGMIDLDVSKSLSTLYNGSYEEIKVLDQIAIRNFQDHIIDRMIRDGGFNREYISSASFRALVDIVRDINQQKEQAYQTAASQIDSLLTHHLNPRQ